MSIVTAFIAATLADSGRIHDIRDSLYAKLRAGSEDYDPVDAHLTLLPSFDVPESQLPRIQKTTTALGLSHTTVTINGLGVWPNIENPRVVLLDCTAPLQTPRQTLLETLDESNADNIRDPAPAHITLFQCENGHTTSDQFKRSLQTTITNHRETWTTEIEYVDVIQNDS